MARLLLNLRYVPDDEADEVRAMLDASGIAFYETRPGPLGITAGAIFVRDDGDMPEARRLMAGYQARRGAAARAEQAAARREGRAETFIGLLRADPAAVLWRVFGIVVVLLLMSLPVILLRR